MLLWKPKDDTGRLFPTPSLVSRIRLRSSGLHGKCFYPRSHLGSCVTGYCQFPSYSQKSHVSLSCHLSSYETKLTCPKLLSHVSYYFSLSETCVWKFVFPCESNIHLLFLKWKHIKLDKDSTADSNRDEHYDITFASTFSLFCAYFKF